MPSVENHWAICIHVRP